MISEELKKARDYEERESALVRGEERPAFHFSPRIGWLNDPNGFSYYNGKYHLFYQYHPYSSLWGPMHWGHAVSDDMISWEYLPAALAPDMEYDRSGCFSGSAITLPDGRQLLMYTGCGNTENDPLGRGRWVQTQCLAVSSAAEDGSTEYFKFEGNPVLDRSDMPEDTDICEFRDPYIWQAPDGTYRMLAANGVLGGIDENGEYRTGKGTQLTLFRSDDGFSWQYDKVLFEDELRIGVMWECPNFFELGGRHVLIASPMDMQAESDDAMGSIRFPQGNNVCYITGDYDEVNEVFSPDTSGRKSRIHGLETGKAISEALVTSASLPDGETVREFYKYNPVDYGLDFYAPQVMKSPDGRTVMIGWMQDPKPSNLHEDGDFRVFGQMTVPRELSMRGGDSDLCQWPVREIESYRSDPVIHTDVELAAETISLDGVKGRTLDLEISIENGGDGGDATYSSFAVTFAADEEHFCRFTYYPDRFVVKLDRSHSSGYEWSGGDRSVRVRDLGGRLDLRILLDRYSAEIFINGGEQVMSMTYFTPLEADGISFTAEGTATLNVTAYKLNRK